MDACRNPQCVNTRARINQLLNEHDRARNRVVSLEKVVASQKEQIQVLEIALAAAEAEVNNIPEGKIVLIFTVHQAAVYKSDFEEERKDREKARGELEDLKKLKGGKDERVAVYYALKKHKAELKEELETTRTVIETLKKQIEKLASEKDDLKYEVERRKKSKSDKTKQLEKLKGQV